MSKDRRVNAFYSTPSLYLDAKHAANETWPVKRGDFFPYADCPHCYWTGYFSSRPAFKRYVRHLSAYLQAARQLEVHVGRRVGGPTSDLLEEAMAMAQHHDAVSGTQKGHVAADYSRRLAAGAAQAEELINAALSRLLERRQLCQQGAGRGADSTGAVDGEHPAGGSGRKDPTGGVDGTGNASGEHLAGGAQAGKESSSEVGRRAALVQEEEEVAEEEAGEESQGSKSGAFERGKGSGEELELCQCGLLNVSYCPPTERHLADGQAIVVVAYNPLAWPRTEYISLPVASEDVTVTDSAGRPLLSQVAPLSDATWRVRTLNAEAHLGVVAPPGPPPPVFELTFSATVGPLGIAKIFILPGRTACALASTTTSTSTSTAGIGSHSPVVSSLEEGGGLHSREGEVAIGTGPLRLVLNATSGSVQAAHLEPSEVLLAFAI
eukprot:jgi/Mesen1/717/ME000109S_10930